MRAQSSGPEKAGPRAGEGGVHISIGLPVVVRGTRCPGVGGGRYWNAGASGAGSAGTGRLPSADPPPSCSPFASVPEWDRGPCLAGRRLCRSPRTPPPWPGSLTRRRSRQYSGPREAGAALGPPHGDRSRASRGKSPWAAAMALKMVKGIIDCMFDSNLQD